MKKHANIITKKQAEEFYRKTGEIITIMSNDDYDNFYFVDKHSIPIELDKNKWTPMTLTGYTMEESENTFYDKNKYLGV